MNKAKLRKKMKLEKWENSFLEINKKKRRNIERQFETKIKEEQ